MPVPPRFLPPRVGWLRVVPEVRWTLLSTAAFAGALLIGGLGAPVWATGALYGACYAAGG